MSNGERSNIWSTVLIVALMVGMLVISRFVCGKGTSGGGCMGMGGGTPQDTTSVPPRRVGSQIITPIELTNDTILVRIIPWEIYSIWDSRRENGTSDKELYGSYNIGFRIDQVILSQKDTTEVKKENLNTSSTGYLANTPVVPRSVRIDVDAFNGRSGPIKKDDGNGILRDTTTGTAVGTIDYETGEFSLDTTLTTKKTCDYSYTTLKYSMRTSKETTERVPVELLHPTRFYAPVPDTVISGDERDTTFAYPVIGSWDDEGFADAADSIERFLYNEHEGFEVFRQAGFTPYALETNVSHDSRVLTLTWVDSLGNSESMLLRLEGYEVKLVSQDSASPGGKFLFWCENGLARTEPGDKAEATMYKLYYRIPTKSSVPSLTTAKWTKYERDLATYEADIARARQEGKDPNEVKVPSYPIEAGPYQWVALRSKYFAAIVHPPEPVNANIKLHATPTNLMGMKLKVEDVDELSLFFGPQDYDMLADKGHRLGRIVELGGAAFRWLGVAFLRVFQFLYKIIPNYGVVIIIFASLLKLVFMPLSRVQHRSMQKMQVLQPKIKEIQERYAKHKNDPEMQRRQNEEIMRLYKNHGASPFMGCLPMLIQLPVFFGLYGVLRNIIALRGAPFVNLFTVKIPKAVNLLNFIRIPAGELTWLADLSMHDPFYILPVLMGVASVVQSLRTNIDPRQRFMTLVFPILITVVFLNFPSGLQLYWLIFNLLSLIEIAIFRRGGQTGGTQQWQTKRQKEIPSARNLPKSSPR